MAGSLLTLEQRRLYDELMGKTKPEWGVKHNGAWIEETVWNSGAQPKVSPHYGTVRIKNNADDTPKTTRNTFMATRKFVANLVIEANTSDKFDQTVKVNLLAINLTSDDLTDLLAKAHGHLELVSDK